MIDMGTDEEGDAASFAYLEMVISLASIHKSQMNVVRVLYDIVSRPWYLD